MQNFDFSTMSADELRSIISSAQAALQNLETSAATRVVVEFGSYNDRRYSRPWIAKVTSWPVGAAAKLQFGHYLGTDAGGEAEIQAARGDIVRWGQKDNRGKGSTAHWGVVQADGSIAECTESEARGAYRA